jgi:hypothetical protein
MPTDYPRNVPIEPGRPTKLVTQPGACFEVRKEAYPWVVDVAAHLRRHGCPEAVDWAIALFGPPAWTHVPTKIFRWDGGDNVTFLPFEYPLDHRWDVYSLRFYFADQTDACAFRLAWG